MDKVNANQEARLWLQRRWPQAKNASEPVTPVVSITPVVTLYAVRASSEQLGQSAQILITAPSSANAEASVREHLGTGWACSHAAALCRTRDPVFSRIA